jgi:hypothetical protein
MLVARKINIDQSSHIRKPSRIVGNAEEVGLMDAESAFADTRYINHEVSA